MTATRPLVGRTTLTPRALRHLVTGLARDIGQVEPTQISVTVQDTDGELALTVDLPFTITSEVPQSFPERGQVIRDHLVSGTRELAARTTRTVDVRFTTVHRAERKRVT